MALSPPEPPEQPVPLLACGRDAAAVWEHAEATRLDVHERGCPHCQAVVADQRQLVAAIATLSAEALEPPPSLLERVMSAVVAELRPRGYLPLPTREGGARIELVTATAVLRHAVDQMPGVRARNCRIEAPEDEGREGEGMPAVPAMPAVRMSVAARFGTDLVSAAARVRQMVLAAAQEVLGVPVARVDVDVIDVYEPDVYEP